MNERVAQTGRWHRSGKQILILDEEMPTDGTELDEQRLVGLQLPPAPLLRRGSRGAVVTSLQRNLNAWARQSRMSLAPLIEDGVFGPLTEARVGSFQRANGLLVDGIAGPKTLEALRSALLSIGGLTIPASVIRDSPCLSPIPPTIGSRLPRCYCVDGYDTDQRKVGKHQRAIAELIAIDIGRTLVPQGVKPRVTKVVIVGHTDSDGGEAFNLNLGLDRARGVEEVILETLDDSISASAMRVRSRGKSDPIGDNNTPEGKAANRRVEVCLFGPRGAR